MQLRVIISLAADDDNDGGPNGHGRRGADEVAPKKSSTARSQDGGLSVERLKGWRKMTTFDIDGKGHLRRKRNFTPARFAAFSLLSSTILFCDCMPSMTQSRNNNSHSSNQRPFLGRERL